MRKPLHIWTIFLACFGLLLAAMAWVGWHTLALEKERETVARDAEQQERVRLALWRLDFQASALMMRENARPPYDFRPFHAPEGVVSKSYDNVIKGEVLLPSPLLAEVPEHVLLHFQMDSRGQITSPQVPQSGERALALAQFINADVLQRSEERLNSLRTLLARPAAPTGAPFGLPPAPVLRRDFSVSGAKQEAASAFAPAGPPLNRQLLAQAACVARFEFEDKEAVVEGNDVNLPRNPAWAVQQGQNTSQQMLFNGQETLSRTRAFQSQNAEAIKAQPNIKLKEAPAKVVSKAADMPASKAVAAAKPAEKKPMAEMPQEKTRQEAGQAPIPGLAAAPAAAAAAPSAPPVGRLSATAPAAGNVLAEGNGGLPAASVLRKTNGAPPDGSRPFQGVWLGESLVLTREAVVDGVRFVQGVWLDWPALRAAWLREITDLFPDARLEPAAHVNGNSRPVDDPLRFAALPVRLIPRMIELPPLPFWTPLRKSLGIALACVLLAGAAVGLVLYGTVALSERRAAFVSAVTHELRTPLTTFRLYSEMLADGMVQDETQRKTYLDTLTGEAGRLSHLVENVLAYARLERGSGKARAESITIGALLDRILPRLKQRADDCAMEVRVHATEADRKTELHVDAAAVEQILFNLVDNACKYAAPRAAEPVIHLEADTAGKFAMLRVRDHGGGISRSERRRIFHPFHKSADQAAHSAPGVGLGLALCQRLATALGGAITLDAAHKEGACFVLRLPK